QYWSSTPNLMIRANPFAPLKSTVEVRRLDGNLHASMINVKRCIWGYTRSQRSLVIAPAGTIAPIMAFSGGRLWQDSMSHSVAPEWPPTMPPFVPVATVWSTVDYIEERSR